MADLLMLKYKKVFPLPQTRILTEPDYFLKTKSKSITPVVKTGENSLFVDWFEGRFDPMLLLLPPRTGSSPPFTVGGIYWSSCPVWPVVQP